MSFLPYAAPDGRTWFGALGLSTAAHGGLTFFVLFSGAVVLLPDPQSIELRAPEFSVSLEILDADVIDEPEPVEDDRIPEDAVALTPDDLSADTPDETLAALVPDEETLAPEPETLAPLVPEEEALPEEAILTPEPEAELLAAIEPEPAEIEPEDILVPEPAAPELEDIYAAEEPAPVEEAPAAIEPAAIDPGLAIDSLSPIDDAVLNPLAEGSGPALAPEILSEEEEVLAAVALPEPEIVEPAITEPLPEDETIEPVVLPPEDAAEPEEVTPEATVPEVVETPPEPELADPGLVGSEVTEVPADTPEEPAAEVEEPAIAAAAPAPAVLPNPTASDIALGQLIRRIRLAPSAQCVLALPRRAGGAPGAGLSLIGADVAQMDAFATQITSDLDPAPIQTRETVDNRQCAALDALRQSASYPASRIGLALDGGATLRSGDSLQGRVVGAGGLYVTLLIVDDNGVVQDLAPFVSLSDTTLVFDAPVARSGGARATRQLLVAIGTTDAPLDLSDRIGRTAQEVFGPVPSEVLQSAVFGIASFDVR